MGGYVSTTYRLPEKRFANASSCLLAATARRKRITIAYGMYTYSTSQFPM